MAQRKPFTFSQPAASKPPPPPQRPKPQPPPASARAQLLLANSAKIRAKQPAPPPKKKPRNERRPRPPKKREPAHPSLLDMKAHGLTRENAARIVQRHATAAPVVSNDVEWRPPPVAKELPNLPKAQGFYGSKDEKQTASETARGLHGVQLTERLTAVLRPHQLEGVQWLCARLWQRQGCLLADEMGLGKTATCLASLAVLMGIEGSSARPTQKSFRSVVCCPAVRARVEINHSIGRLLDGVRVTIRAGRAAHLGERSVKMVKADAGGCCSCSSRRTKTFSCVFFC